MLGAMNFPARTGKPDTNQRLYASLSGDLTQARTGSEFPGQGRLLILQTGEAHAFCSGATGHWAVALGALAGFPGRTG